MEEETTTSSGRKPTQLIYVDKKQQPLIYNCNRDRQLSLTSRMLGPLEYLFLSTCLSIGALVFAQDATPPPGQRAVTIPPLITLEPSKEMVFHEGESFEMPCEATGKPTPVYKWQMNGNAFDPSGTDGRIANKPGVGTLIFAHPLERDVARYQCFAENPAGIAVTMIIYLRKAFLWTIASRGTRYHRPNLGHPLTLMCVRSRSFPKAEYFWATIAEGDGFTAINLTDRVTMDHQGNLHFANIIPSDANQGRTYACIVQNPVTRTIQQGAYAVIQPQGQTIQHMPPSLLWMSTTHQVALIGETWRVKCIFAGSPTPRVHWRRDGADMPPRSRPESFGQELVIENVQFEDEGMYECEGINDDATVPIRRSVFLIIEASPYWTPDSKLMSVNGTELGKAEFTCQALGKPEPFYSWLLNGARISRVSADSRRVLQGNKLIFYNLTMDDAQVIQCNYTNKHGNILQNAYLNVLYNYDDDDADADDDDDDDDDNDYDDDMANIITYVFVGLATVAIIIGVVVVLAIVLIKLSL